MSELDELNRQLKSIEVKIAEARARMPAHSAKPGMMTELIDLEDQRDKILEKIAALENRADNNQ
ncbi:MAG: hypothetical protein U5L07_12760 [Desulfobacterales bacterium]|nr:hypothetical protein [Desulfobacterales bacterium]